MLANFAYVLPRFIDFRALSTDTCFCFRALAVKRDAVHLNVIDVRFSVEGGGFRAYRL